MTDCGVLTAEKLEERRRLDEEEAAQAARKQNGGGGGGIVQPEKEEAQETEQEKQRNLIGSNLRDWLREHAHASTAERNYAIKDFPERGLKSVPSYHNSPPHEDDYLGQSSAPHPHLILA